MKIQDNIKDKVFFQPNKWTSPKNRIRKILWGLLSVIIMTACAQIPSSTLDQNEMPTNQPTVEVTYTPFYTPPPEPTTTFTLKSTSTNTLQPSSTPLLFQTLGRIFPEGYDSVGVWANQNSGAIDSRNTHFDVALPAQYLSGQDIVLSPAAGKIIEVYSVGENGEGGQVVTIQPYPPLDGIKELALANGLDPDKIIKIFFHLGHITVFKTEGFIEKGEPIGTPYNISGVDKIAYIIRVIFEDCERQFSPCDLPNTAEFCGVCAPGTPNPCP